MKKLLVILALVSTAAFALPPENKAIVEVPATAIDPNVTVKQLCTSGYTAGKKADGSDVRHVRTADRKAVYKAAGVVPGTNPIKCYGGPKKSPYEVDHIISLQLGGSNHISNLMLQPYCGEWNAKDKDRLENYLHDEMLCKGKMSLPDVQRKIYVDWKAAYMEYFAP